MGRGRLRNIWAFGCTYGRKYIYRPLYTTQQGAINTTPTAHGTLPFSLSPPLSHTHTLTYTLYLRLRRLKRILECHNLLKRPLTPNHALLIPRPHTRIIHPHIRDLRDARLTQDLIERLRLRLHLEILHCPPPLGQPPPNILTNKHTYQDQQPSRPYSRPRPGCAGP